MNARIRQKQRDNSGEIFPCNKGIVGISQYYNSPSNYLGGNVKGIVDPLARQYFQDKTTGMNVFVMF